MEQLKGLKIAHVHKDDAYGRETIPLLDHQAALYGFTVQHVPVQAPGLDQKATCLRVQVARPDWVILRTTGDVMAMTTLKEVPPHPCSTEHGAAPDCLQRPLLRRSRFRQQVSASVRCQRHYEDQSL
jgi:hypothetical protein